MPGHTSNVHCIGFDQKAENLFAGTEKGDVYVWDLSSQQANVLSGHSGKISSITHEDQQSILVTSGEDSKVKIWDARASNTEAIFTFSKHTAPVKDCAISPDGRWVASGGADGIVKIWELDTGKII